MSDQDFEEHPSINDDEERVRINRTLRAADVLAEAAKQINDAIDGLASGRPLVDLEARTSIKIQFENALAAYEKVRGLKSNG